VSCSPAGALLLVASLFAAGCTETFVAEQNDARDFIDEQLPVGTRRSDAVTLLRTESLAGKGVRALPEFHIGQLLPVFIRSR